MFNYETPEMEHSEAIRFATKFDMVVGTEKEINRAENGMYYVVCCELAYEEIEVCANIWKEVTKR